MATNEPQTAPAPPLCEVRGVSHDFALPTGQTLRVLDKVDLAIHPGEVVALLGPSGCGKSTVLRILAGLVRPTEGSVLYHGQPLRGRNPGVAIVFQSFALLPWMTARRNVEVVLDALGLAPEEIRARVEDTIRIVGLTGFEDVYPRELSGGMKQRVGMARALAVNPELLLLDEPFSAVDALTAESLRAEVIDIWSIPDRNPSSMLMVSHDIPEVAWMADRIVVLSARPGRVGTVVDNRLPRPRDYRSPELLALVDELHDVITGHELPDHAPATPLVEPLPATTPSEIVGLLEYLDARGGADDLPRIAADTGRQFDHVICVVQGAEMVGLVDTPRRRVVLTPLARRYLASSQDERKRIWRHQILALRLFGEIDELLGRARGGRIDGDVARGIIAMQLPQEDHDRVFEQVVRWARFGDLFDYDEASGALRKE